MGIIKAEKKRIMAIITESPREKPRKILYKKELKESGFKKYYIKKNLKKAASKNII